MGHRSFSPMPAPPAGSIFTAPLHSHHAGFPIIAVAIIGILATGLLLVSYYVFVIKCCLNWHRIDLLRRFSFSRRRRVDEPFAVFSPPVENRGLDEAAIRSIPIFQYKKEPATADADAATAAAACECAVCLSEFQETEKLRMIPNCGHVFHIDCIDIWLQSNANCPLCRNSISSRAAAAAFMIAPATTPQDPILNINPSTEDDDYVVIEISTHDRRNNNTNSNQSLVIHSGELSSTISITPSPRPKISRKKPKNFAHVSSFGDECIDIRHKDEQFAKIQPIRRSFSMDSAADRQLFLAVQEIVQQHSSIPEVNDLSESGSSSRIKRSFFSFGHGWGSRNAVQPVHQDP
ncbi:RING-H2 finger protein ATL16 [Ipomoea triloba]|uniref:RING-H2 finger protein ATL16 n=1 Tax=Ipomoea triloba TaxID=35885 RepID=UPI00125E2C22|nr:RING-H2 finger protein ATL16 [Ipomoea triloba]